MTHLIVTAKVDDEQYDNIIFEEAEFDVDTKGLWIEQDGDILAHFPHGTYLSIIAED